MILNTSPFIHYRQNQNQTPSVNDVPQRFRVTSPKGLSYMYSTEILDFPESAGQEKDFDRLPYFTLPRCISPVHASKATVSCDHHRHLGNRRSSCDCIRQTMWGSEAL